MKGGQLALLLWCLNLAVAAGGLFIGGMKYLDSKEDLDNTFDAPTRVKSKSGQGRIDWAAASKTGSVDISAFGYRELSPRKRPPPPKQPDPTPKQPDPVPKEPTDDELKAELQKEINAKFKLVRLMYSTNPELAKALVTASDAGNASVMLFAGLNFPKYFGADGVDAKIKVLAAKDYTVKSIEKDSVQIEAPSIKKPAKRFTVALKFADAALPKPPDRGKFGTTGTGSGGTKIPQPPEKTGDNQPTAVADDRPEKSSYDEKSDTWTLGKEDYIGINTDDFLKYAKTVVDEKGQPIGIQISDEIPEDNVVIKRGGKKGDIIKSINGIPVTNMADIKRTVRKQYEEGTTEFDVVFERDGVPQHKIFRVPQKKKNK